jgi:hypothetical protein
MQPRVRVPAERPRGWTKRASEVLTFGSTARLREERQDETKNDQLEMLMKKGGDLAMPLLPVRLRYRMCTHTQKYLCPRILESTNFLSHTRMTHLAVIGHHCRWLEMLRSVVLTLVQVSLCMAHNIPNYFLAHLTPFSCRSVSSTTTILPQGIDDWKPSFSVATDEANRSALKSARDDEMQVFDLKTGFLAGCRLE